MMYYQHGGMGGEWLALLLVLLGILLVVATVSLINRAPLGRPRRSASEQVLADRFARGDIDAEEYRSRLRELRDQ